jgi:two-component system, chemotaxis family, protein-glutamate methylesterase/glutaminase
MIKVLVADDSALMRRHLRELFESEPGFTVRAVRNGAEVITELDAFDPDVITLDINMPVMDGMTCLSRIMTHRPKPVVMVSSLTAEGTEATLQALGLGAVDFVLKPDGTISLSVERIHAELLAKVRAAARARPRRTTGLRGRLENERARIAERGAPTRLRPLGRSRPAGFGMVVVGVSTGGPGMLEEILSRLPADFPWAILIAQHMPQGFTGVFARRLNEAAAVTVVEVAQQMPIEPGVVYIARGDADMIVLHRERGLIAAPVPASSTHLWHPSVDRLVRSATDALPADSLIGVQLTGMGDDGAEAMAAMHRRGAYTIAQDEATSVVFGMPGELIRRGGASVVAPANRIAGLLMSHVSSTAAPLREGVRHAAHQGR